MNRPDDYRADAAFCRRFMADLKLIAAPFVLEEAPYEEDARHATDMMVLGAGRDLRIACRVRRYGYWLKPEYRDEFTIRVDRPSGVETELSKVVGGWARFFIYGFADAEALHLHAWFIADLNVFRSWRDRWRGEHGGTEPGRLMANRDGSSSFRAYALATMPAGFILARQAPEPPAAPRPNAQPTPTPIRPTTPTTYRHPGDEIRVSAYPKLPKQLPMDLDE